MRQAHIVSVLKQGRRVNVEKLQEELRNTELPDGSNLGCGRHTVLRDIQILDEKYGCRIKYSHSDRSYYMENPNWTFKVPALLDENDLLAVILGGKVAGDIFPSSISNAITSAVDELVRGNSADFMGKAMFDSLKIFTGCAVLEDTDVFPKILRGWREHRVVHIKYADEHGGESERNIDPHALVFHEGYWSVKAWCRLRKAARTFVISRIIKAELLPDMFYPRQEIVDAVSLENLYDFKRKYEVKIRLNMEGKRKAELSSMHPEQKIEVDGNGGFILTIPSVAPEIIVPWIMRQCGDAIPLSPPEIVEEIRKNTEKILQLTNF